ncbi:hypothetical protein [Pontivivens insulae]|uniref:Peptidase S1 n=1 Tax=Pontivivens insulae TaxID=1639689 RepID=A0A2R8ABR2_9RHOB|nr:hypothetical protein [Pontivivens insulae]RED11164.1 hypothetical protein DFR53_3194 [Pontivivens insulae]SPF29662.1 hypothetical protein POI8812_01978 [Pontivivens insulae]
MKTLVAAAALTLCAGAAHACPDFSYSGYGISASGSQLYSASTYQVIAGGSSDLAACGFSGYGFVAVAPDFELYYSQDGAYDLTFRLNTACDSILLINDPNGNWWWDDDSNGNLDASINVGRGVDGTYDIWVGTVGAGTCDASITFETF